MYREIISDNNLYEFPDGLDTAAIVTTNGIVKCDSGDAVMGAGIAKYVNDTWDHLPAKWLGKRLRALGNHAFYLGDVSLNKNAFRLISFPTKYDYREPSDLELIKRSCEELIDICNKTGIKTCYLCPPGCGLGGLNYLLQVKPLLNQMLNDSPTQFIGVIPSRLLK